MKISLSWLRTFVDLQAPVETIEEALTLIGFEVEGIERTGIEPLDKVVVGEVLAREPHPDADRLSVCQVRVAPDGEPAQIVCGATNFKVGDRVPVALPGARLPGDFKIKRSKLRGVVSEGMMCSARELQLGDDHAGLMILADAPEVGTPIHQALPEPDTIFDIEVTPNRPDCLSHIGIARELAAWFRLPLNYPGTEVSYHDPFEPDPAPLLSRLTVEDPELAPYYTACSIRGVRIGPSPDWMVRRIESLGLRSVNNVVDITNLVLLECGQPLHAFDAAKIKGSELRVRRARAGETLRTLDDRNRELTTDDLVIADADRPLVIAGVMGSLDAEVDDQTTDIVLEAATFDALSVRRTSRRLGLSTDSSYRFERGVDPAGLIYAAERAIDLIRELAGGQVAGDPALAGKPPLTETEIFLSPEFVRQRCGFGPPDEEIQTIFESLEMEVSHNPEDEEWIIRVPSFRTDLTRPVDLVEEFLRIYGTDKIPSRPVRSVTLPGEDSPRATRLMAAARALVGGGFRETCNYSLRPEEEVAHDLGAEKAARLALANPLTSDQTHLRPSLLPGLLDVLHTNAARNRGDFRFFETGRVFLPEKAGFSEGFAIAFVIMERPGEARWKRRPASDFFTARSTLERACAALGIDPAILPIWESVSESPLWISGHAATAGFLPEDGFALAAGFVQRAVLRRHDLKDPVLAGEILLRPDFLDQTDKASSYRPLSPFPFSSRDLAVVVPRETPAATVRAELTAMAVKAAGDTCAVEDVHLFDVYTGTGMAPDQKSLAFTLTFRRADRTLTDEEAQEVFNRVQEAVRASAYQIRS